MSFRTSSARERIDGYSEQAAETGDDAEMAEWLEASLAVLGPLERRLTRVGSLVSPGA